jgi:hypothetical protein
MSASTELPALAVEQGWAVNTTTPDYWGDVRTTAVSDEGTIRMVFDQTGKLLGGYMSDARRRNWHTTRVQDVQRWLGAV